MPGIEADMEEQSLLGRSKILLYSVLLLLFIMGLGVRLVDLSDPPLDFHPTRQLRSAIIARSLYYRMLPASDDWHRQRAIEQFSGEGIIEPIVFESIVAATYRVIGFEAVWIARIYAALFWVIGGVALYLLTRSMTSPDGGVIAVAYYLFLPFGIIASRSFQPDPLMVMFILLALWSFDYWAKKPSWRTALLVGGLSGMALFVKAVALLPLLFAMAGFLIFRRGIRQLLRDPQVLAIAVLAVLPMLAYHIYGVYILGTLESQFEGRFFPEMWSSPAFYLHWEDMASGIVGYGAIFASLIGILLLPTPAYRAMGFGLWIGYFLYGMTFPYHITTHSYYHLPLIAIIGFTLAPVGATVLRSLANLKPAWMVRLTVIGVVFTAIFIKAWNVRVDLIVEDYRHEPAYWAKIGEILGHSSSVIGLTHDYGNRLAYYGWITPRIWLPLGHQSFRELQGKPPIEVHQWFADKAGNKDFFLVTMLNQFDKQPELKDLLYNNYPIFAEGEGYLIFDLRHPKKAGD